jgi:hypothetical protein
MSAVPMPVLAWETILNNAGWFLDDLPEGGKLLKFVPVQPTPQGNMPMAPAFAIVFSEDGWERFQRDIAAGRNSPIVLPGVNGNGGAP